MEPNVILTERLKDKLRRVLTIRQTSSKLQEINYVLNNPDSQIIPFRLLRYAFNQYKNTDGITEYLNEWMEGSDLYLPQYEQPPRNPELEERIQRLKAEQSNRDYKNMVKNVDRQQKADTESIGAEVRALNTHIWAVINFIVTVGGAFAFGFKAAEYSYNTSANSIVPQMVIGLIFATVVFFADLYFLVRQTS